METATQTLHRLTSYQPGRERDEAIDDPRRQLHDILRHPGYDSMLAARGEGLPEDR